MKKTIFVFGLLFFLLHFFPAGAQCFCHANNNEISNYSYHFDCEGELFNFETKDFKNEIDLSQTQKQLFKKHTNRFEIFSLTQNLGLTEKESFFYAFPELKQITEVLSQKLNKTPKSPDIQVCLNACKIKFKPGKKGFYFDEESFFKELKNFKNLNTKTIKFKIQKKEYTFPEIKKSDFVEKSCFSTNFSSSSPERKNNIKLALSKFDGIVLNEGEFLSFNKTTGLRTEEQGYKQAKIISGGTFVSGFGGGVCQVSTTIYNASLLAGLEIVEVHQHSLPVGYVEPSFDAMVNAGSSDLVIQNNTGGKIVFTTSFAGDVCKVKIFGKPNKHKITRVSEKTKIIPSEGDVVETDLKKYNQENLAVGEEKRLSFPKDGYESKGYLNYYNPDGTLEKTQKIRENRYAPVKGVIIKSL